MNLAECWNVICCLLSGMWIMQEAGRDRHVTANKITAPLKCTVKDRCHLLVKLNQVVLSQNWTQIPPCCLGEYIFRLFVKFANKFSVSGNFSLPSQHPFSTPLLYFTYLFLFVPEWAKRHLPLSARRSCILLFSCLHPMSALLTTVRHQVFFCRPVPYLFALWILIEML